jgi:class 3 adenylate cyclase/tetratricopeptide (TPR) repeat protein
VAVCPSCGTENPEGAKFCNGCGVPLAETTPASTLEERKVVSVLFCDLVGFTAASEAADPEDVRARLRPYHARVRQEIESYGGTVEKFVGDAVMAIFGAPTAHEDDAERAVRAALRILEAIQELNGQDPGLALQVRIGINTGEAVVALGARPEQGEGIVTGDVVNTAARLQTAAPVGTLVVGELTFQTTAQVIDYEELEPMAAKGKAEPLSLWLAKRPQRSFGAELDTGAHAPFIGREHELALLRETYARTLRESSIQLVTLTGEPGVGKSRMVAELRLLAGKQPEPVVWRQGRCLPYGEGITFWALGEIIKAQAGVLDSDDPVRAAEKLAAAVEEVIEETSERAWFQAMLAPLVGASGAESEGAVERSQSFTAWRRFFEGIAVSGPLVLVFEDLHWADDAMLEFVEHLVDWSMDVPLLVLCTARPELYEWRASWGGGKRNSTTVSLSPLTTQETAQLIGTLLSQAVLPAETQSTLLERAGGNPLYAEEFVRMLGDRGILERDGAVIRIGEGAEIPVPETIQALIAARLDTLSPEVKSLLQAASVVGKVFWTGAVASVSGAEEDSVATAMHELARKELVRPVRSSSVQGEEEYAFWHVLVRDVAYGQIPRAARAAKHRAAAEWMEGIAGERVIDYAELLAHHYEQALELSRAAGVDTRDLEKQTERFLVLAGQRALWLDVGKAGPYFRRALELLAPEDPRRSEVLVHAAGAAALAGRPAEAEASYEEAITEFSAQGNTLAAGDALAKLAAIIREGQSARAKALLDEAIDLLEREPLSPELVGAYAEMTRYYHFAWPAEEALEWAEKTIVAAEKLGLEGARLRALRYRGFARTEVGDPRGLDDENEAFQASLELGGDHAMDAYLAMSDLTWWSEGPAAGLAVYRAGIELAERSGRTYYATYLKGESVWPLFDLGEWDVLQDVAREVLTWDRGSYQALLALPYIAHVLLCRGSTSDAADLRADFLPRARRNRDPQVLIPALSVSALIDTERGDVPGAIALIEELEQSTRRRSLRRAQHLPDALRVCAATGATHLAELLLTETEVCTARQLHAVHTARAVLAEMQGRIEEALALYEEAAERWARYGFVLEHAQALLGVGRCLLRFRRPAAEVPLDEARELFASLGYKLALAEARALLEQTAARAS